MVSGRLAQALALIDAAHAEDPEKDAAGEPKELVYARRMSAWLEKLEPAASETLKLAIRCQHLRRWTLRRGDYPAGTAGYRRWRADEAAAHAQAARQILEESGYAAEPIQRVQALVLKLNLKADAETQLLEDVTCLVFLESYFAQFAAKHDEPTLVRVLRKTWTKMSARGHEAALGLKLPPALRAIVEKAVSK